MSQAEDNIKYEPLGVKNKLTSVRILVYQFHSEFEGDWEKKSNLYYPKRISKFEDTINKVLELATEMKVTLVVFPELSIHEENIPQIEEWSRANRDAIVIAGTYYKTVPEYSKPFNTCPVIYQGRKYESMKRDASGFEGTSIQSNPILTVYEDTPIGRFAVIICSDFLSDVDGNFRDIAKSIDLDFVIVPAFQRKADDHHRQMTTHIGSLRERFIVYCNHKNQEADGQSAFYANLHKDIVEKLKQDKATDYLPKYKAVSPVTSDWDYFIIKVNPYQKAPRVDKKIGGETLIVEKVGRLIPQMEKTAKPPQNPKVIEQFAPTEVVKGVIPLEKNLFTILERNKYEEIARTLNEISKKPHQYDELFDQTFIADIEKSLDEFGMAFVTAPICFGKSFLLRYVQERFSHLKFVSEINANQLSVVKDGIESHRQLYYRWFQLIAHQILFHGKKSMADLEPLNRRLYAALLNETQFIQELNANSGVGNGDIGGLVRLLADLKTDVGLHGDILITFHLDDAQKYVRKKVFEELRQEFIEYKYSIGQPIHKSVKLLVASRYFANPPKNSIVKVIPYFEYQHILYFAKMFSREMEDSKGVTDLTALVLEKTDGYPWFVKRFFLLFVELRMRGVDKHPMDLAEEIFETEKMWKGGYFTGSSHGPEYFDELLMLIQDAQKSQATTIRKFKEFIELPPDSPFDNGWIRNGDLLLHQSGFLGNNNKGINNGCYIMQKHYRKELSSLLS